MRSGVIGLALIGALTAGLWWWAVAICRSIFPHPGAMPVLILVVATAAYLCVPETDQFKGVALLVVGLGLVELVGREVLPMAWHGALLTVVLWSALYGATGRASAVVGAVFAGWAIVLPALGWTLASRRPRRLHSAVATIACVAALVVARTGALDRQVRPAAIWATAAGAASAVMALLLLQPGRHRLGGR